MNNPWAMVAPEGALGPLLRCPIGPQMVARRVGEAIDLILGHPCPVGHEDLAPDVALPLFQYGCCRHGHAS